MMSRTLMRRKRRSGSKRPGGNAKGGEKQEIKLDVAAIPARIKAAMLKAVGGSDARETLTRIAFKAQGKPYFPAVYAITLGLIHAVEHPKTESLVLNGHG